MWPNTEFVNASADQSGTKTQANRRIWVVPTTKADQGLGFRPLERGSTGSFD
jgi:hypothetical protein